MADWYCFKDKEKLIEGQVTLGYGPTEVEQVALICPKCHAAYINERDAVDQLLPADDYAEIEPTEPCC